MRAYNSKLLDFLQEHKEKNAVSFHMPGHKGTRFFKKFGFDGFFEDIASADITEIDGADNLFAPQGIISELMKEYRELYASRASYLLVNGSSSGIEAAILACVKVGGKLIMARDSHKSVYNAVELGNLTAVYAMPKIMEGYGIAAAIEPDEIERLLCEHEDAEAVIVPSPNYYGICSDIRKIASSCHAHGKILIVDEAHGAHLKFFACGKEFRKAAAGSQVGSLQADNLQIPAAVSGLPQAAEDAGADIVVVSTHKTLASFTQSAVLNVMSDRVDLEAFCARLSQLTSTSPSYILMASLAMNAKLLREQGSCLFQKWQENLDFFYENAEKIDGLRVVRTAGKSESGFELFDKSKLNLDMSACGYNGYELEKELIKYGIYPELSSGNLTMCMSGIGNERRDYERLLGALHKISQKYKNTPRTENCLGILNNRTDLDGLGIQSNESKQITGIRKLPDSVENIDGYKKIKTDIRDAEGVISAVHIVPYPPGIPIVCPREIISGEIIREVLELKSRGEKVLGVEDDLSIRCYKR